MTITSPYYIYMNYSGFQVLYTTIFGAYSAYLFLRTGHFVAPFIVHAFCNHMGFPDFSEVIKYNEPKRTLTLGICVVGLISWCLLLTPLTNPSWYSNNIYWKTEPTLMFCYSQHSTYMNFLDLFLRVCNWLPRLLFRNFD